MKDLVNNTESVYTYDILNRVTAYTYDNRGNISQMTVDGVTYTYTYDSLNQLVSVTTNNDSFTATYTYDAAGIRTQKNVHGVVTEYFLDGSTILAEEGERFLCPDSRRHRTDPCLAKGRGLSLVFWILFRRLIMKNVFKLICAAILAGCMLSGCVSPLMYNRHPADQPGTIWSTQDGKVIFTVPEDGSIPKGIIQTEDGPVDVALAMSMQYMGVEVCYAEDYEKLELNELFPSFDRWVVKKVRKNVFVVEVRESIYFESGEILKFYKTKTD